MSEYLAYFAKRCRHAATLDLVVKHQFHVMPRIGYVFNFFSILSGFLFVRVPERAIFVIARGIVFSFFSSSQA